MNDRQRRAAFARLAKVSSLPGDDADLKNELKGRYTSLSDRYHIPEQTLAQHNAFGLDVDGVLITKNFIPKFRVFEPNDYFEDARKNTIYVTNYRDIDSELFDQTLKSVMEAARRQNLTVEATEDPLGF